MGFGKTLLLFRWPPQEKNNSKKECHMYEKRNFTEHCEVNFPIPKPFCKHDLTIEILRACILVQCATLPTI